MAEDTDEDEEAGIELGEGEAVEGAPLARVAARLTWAIQKSEVKRKEGDVEIRTPEGPRRLGDVLDEVDETYFPTQQSFTQAVRDAIGLGPVPTAETTEE
ncbi:MAG: DUF5789 family protein [Halodesulfurarchaeum sp.]